MTPIQTTAALACVLCAAPITRANERVLLAHGPLQGDAPRVFDLRTQRPHSLVLVFRSNAAGPYVPADPALPALGVAPYTTPFTRTTDAHGRLRVVLPATGLTPPAGRSAFQALVRAADGRWDSSNAVAVRRGVGVPTSGWLAEAATTPLPPASASLGAHAVVAADLDRDGDADLLLPHASGLAVWFDEGSAGYVDTGTSRIAQLAVPVNCVATADVDRDGDVDVYASGTYDGSVWPDRLWRNDGTGHFTETPGFPAGDGSASSAEFGDVDGDSYPELLVARGGDGHGQLLAPCSLLRNTAGSYARDIAFEQAAWNHALAPAPVARFGDFDGDLDVYVGRSDISGTYNGPGEPNVLLVNDGTGVFSDETAARFAQVRSDNSLDARFVDVDLDGDLDIVVANSVGGVTPAASGDLWINQGGLQGGVVGTFVDDAASPLENTSILHRVRLGVIAADVDTDGDPDLLVTVHDLPPASQHMLLLNQGGAQHGVVGRFERASWFAPGAFVAAGAAFVDRGCDGDLELVLPANGTLTGDVATGQRVLWMETTLP